ncbi:hypothetical protein Tco_1487568, partial [Tanacetum coccineum]
MVNGEVQLQALVDGKKIVVNEATIRRDLQLEDADGVDCLPNATNFEQLRLMGYEKHSQKLTFYTAFFSPQWKFLIHTILQCLSAKTTAWNEFSSTMASAIIYLATNQKFNFSKYIFESMMKNLDNAVKFLMKQKSRRPKEKDTQTPQSSIPSDPTNVADEVVTKEPSMQLKELMDFCTKLQQIVLDLENTKISQAREITSLKKRVKKLEKKGGSRTHKLKRLYSVGRSARVVSSEEESLDEDMFGVNDLEGDEVVVESEVADKDANLSINEVTLAQALAALKSAKVQEKGDAIKEPSIPVSAASTKVSTIIPTTAAITITAISSRPRAKGIDKGKVKKLAFKLQAEEDEEERLAREKAQKVEELNIDWDDIQAKVEADYQLAQRLQAQEQEELIDAEKTTLFVQLLEKRRKHFAAKRAEEKRNRPP